MSAAGICVCRGESGVGCGAVLRVLLNWNFLVGAASLRIFWSFSDSALTDCKHLSVDNCSCNISIEAYIGVGAPVIGRKIA
jgi:hypothetical protein